MKQVISVTNHAAGKHVQNSIRRSCNWSPEIKIIKNGSMKKFDFYLSGAVVLFRCIKRSR